MQHSSAAVSISGTRACDRDEKDQTVASERFTRKVFGRTRKRVLATPLPKAAVQKRSATRTGVFIPLATSLQFAVRSPRGMTKIETVCMMRTNLKVRQLAPVSFSLGHRARCPTAVTPSLAG